LAAVQPSNAQLCSGTNPPCVLTAAYGNLRQGYNGYETTLTPSKVQGGLTQPGWSPLTVDAAPSGVLGANGIYAQPLYVAGITVGSDYQSNCNNLTVNQQPACNMLIAVTLTGSIWAWNADTGSTIWNDCGSGCTRSTLPVADCPMGQNGSVANSGFGEASLPFAGTGSTPVIDPSQSPPAMYVTSLCQTANTQNNQHWYLHKIDLTTGADAATPVEITGSATDWNGADDDNNGAVSFAAWQQMQRPALLQVNISNAQGGNPSSLIYIAFGFGVTYEDTQPYHGWIFAYDTSLNQKLAFLTTANGGGSGNTDYPPCISGCYCTPNQSGGCGATNTCCTGQGTSCVASGYQESANFCGHAAGIWGGAGRGPVGALDSNGVSHAYFGTANGAFQQWQHDHTTLLNPIKNWGESVVDLTLSASTFDSSPSEYFTPFGGVAVEPPLGTESGGNPVNWTFEGLNQNDFDMAQSGLLGFTDLSGKHRLVIVDKAGYGYLLRRGNLCGSTNGCYPGTPSGDPGFRSTDPGNLFPFGANLTQCADQEADSDCHRITSLALCPDCSPELLLFWPYQETMTEFQLSDNTAKNGSGTLSYNTSSCTTGVCLSSGGQVIVGDQIVVSGQPTQTVTSVNSSGTQLTVYDQKPPGGRVWFPGGVVQITSNGGTGTVIWSLANLGATSPGSGSLLAYDTSLNLLWCVNASGSCNSNMTFSLAKFALPTIVNGYVYVPTGSNTTGVEVFH
jgi:hypothetical protein